ncbi:PREDICTED: uncharacterized protein LOC106124123 [Papilio xuthus]|uniref:Uncharacterized protein LOC106124123 n=1 Tax=Papilio xuthus TaxID=66420 RepID=A0AAJ6ZN26_PAPXU|nr:PREDICTED: uncharacterized protein LOC106124123 [Papilio xuthus]
MLYLILAICIAAVIQCNGNKPIVVLDPKLVENISENAEKCYKEVGAGSELLANLIPWNLEENETNGKFLLCLSKKLKCDGEDGHLNVDEFIALFESSLKEYDINIFKEILESCNEESGKNEYFTIFKVLNCFDTKSPVSMAVQ